MQITIQISVLAALAALFTTSENNNKHITIKYPPGYDL